MMRNGFAQPGHVFGRSTLVLRPDEILSDVLARRDTAILYEMSRALRAAFPNQFVLETSDYDFNVRGFGGNGHCETLEAPDLYAQFKYDWSAYHDEVVARLQTGWQKILWQDHEILFLYVEIKFQGCSEEWRYAIADTETVALEFFEAVCRWNNEIRGEILVFKDGYWQKSEELFDSIQSTSLDTLVLPQALKDEVCDTVRNFFLAEETYDRYRLPWKRGLLFLGPPGNGKTHMIKGLANELGYPILYVRSFTSARNTPHHNIGSAFERAREMAPCLFVLEDLDALVDDRNRSYFLNEMDGFYSNRGILTLATTNHPEKLDPAILDRPSRFDRKFNFTLPEEPERYRFLALQNEKLEENLRMSDQGLAAIAKQTEGFSFAYLKELVLSSMMVWIREEGRRSMDEVAPLQVESLAGQMKTEPSPVVIEQPEENDEF